MDEPVTHVRQAIQELGHLNQGELINRSSLYKSKPMGPANQPDYVNAVVSIKTELEPLVLLDALQAIETAHGRLRSDLRWGPRTLDLDILLFGQKVINQARLIIPHPGLHERAFVLYPLQEICPELMIPGKGQLSSLLQSCPADGLKKL